MGVDDDPPFQLTVTTDGRTREVRVSGELDLATRDALDEACFAGNELDIKVDLSDLRFMDCSGYRALEAARTGLETQGGSVEICFASGQPQRLINLIAASEAKMSKGPERVAIQRDRRKSAFSRRSRA